MSGGLGMGKDTRTALLDSAERAARAKGIDGFSYADLAEEVGIRKASIHYHFPTKADLSVAMMQRYAETFLTICKEIEATNATGAARLLVLISKYRDAIGNGRSLCLCVALSGTRDSLPPETINVIRGFRAQMIDWLRDSFALGRQDGSIHNPADPREEAAACLSLLEGAQLAARAEENAAAFDGALSALKKRLG